MYRPRVNSGIAHEDWRKSSRCIEHGHCVEVALKSETVAMRDSKDPASPVLRFDPEAWLAFVADLKRGALDGPPPSA